VNGPRKFVASAADRDRTLAQFLADRLGVELSHVRERIASGAVWVDRARALDPDAAIRPGQKITAHRSEPRTAELTIVHRDGDAIVIDKPPGVASQATRAGIASAEDWARRQEPEARLVHRLDRDASGLLLLSRHADARARFARVLADGRLERRYRAVVWGDVAGSPRSIDRPIGRDPDDRRRQRVGSGRPARTEMTVIRKGRSLAGSPITLVELRLVTGRTHQIRVHMASIGHPVCGDRLYAGEAEPHSVERLALHAVLLAWPGTEVRAPSSLVVPALADLLRLE
jgi:RluA family pseudouridine synthase